MPREHGLIVLAPISMSALKEGITSKQTAWCHTCNIFWSCFAFSTSITRVQTCCLCWFWCPFAAWYLCKLLNSASAIGIEFREFFVGVSILYYLNIYDMYTQLQSRWNINNRVLGKLDAKLGYMQIIKSVKQYYLLLSKLSNHRFFKYYINIDLICRSLWDLYFLKTNREA